MAVIALKAHTAAAVVSTTNSNVVLDIVGIPQEQLTLPAGETIKAGAPVRINTSGQFVECIGTTAANANAYGIAVRRATVGQSVTAIRKGILAGFDFSQAYWSTIYVSDTVGVLGDAAGTATRIVGKIVPVHSHIRGGSAMKALLVDFAISL